MFIRKGNQSIHFVTRLHDLTSCCDYGDAAKELIRDRPVCGIRDDQLQCTLLAVVKFTFEKAYELAILHEAVVLNSRLLSAHL